MQIGLELHLTRLHSHRQHRKGKIPAAQTNGVKAQETRQNERVIIVFEVLRINPKSKIGEIIAYTINYEDAMSVATALDARDKGEYVYGVHTPDADE